MKKNLLIMALAFVGATLLFAGVSLIFGETLMSTFMRITDGWLGIVAYMCVCSFVVRVVEKAKFTKTYIFMMILFLANFVLFFYASSTSNSTHALVAVITSLACGACGIVLPFAVHAIESHRGDNNDGTGSIDTDAMQKQWQRLRKHVLKMSTEKKIEVLKEKLAFRLVGDSLYGALDFTRGMVTTDDKAMTFEAGLENSISPVVLEEAENYIKSLC